MKKYEALYDWPIGRIQFISDSDEAEAYSDELDDNRVDSFTTLTEQIRNIGAEFSQAKASRVHSDKWSDLQGLLKQFEEQFNDFPDSEIRKFRLFVLLAAKVKSTLVPLDAVNFDENQFEYKELDCSFPFSWFSKQNQNIFAASIVIFNSSEWDKLENELSGVTLTPALLFQILGAYTHVPADTSNHIVLIQKQNPSIEVHAVAAFAKMVVLANGGKVHSQRVYPHNLSVVNGDSLAPGSAYQQWGEIFHVLSEYNSRNDILIKYLTLYHVIENLMFKLPIVNLEKSQNGRMFSIRDFRRLYKRVDDNEINALKSLFKEAFSLEVTPGVNFRDHIVQRWSSVFQDHQLQANLNDSLAKLDVTVGDRPMVYGDFNNEQALNLFTKIVYYVRNAIVHNKETELHLTYAALDDGFCCPLLSEFLLPCLEEISFKLIGTPNSPVWYANKEICLYG